MAAIERAIDEFAEVAAVKDEDARLIEQGAVGGVQVGAGRGDGGVDQRGAESVGGCLGEGRLPAPSQPSNTMIR
ncbi:hypothetical protein ACIA5C_47670 [Actinoplanes sp. NPDC051343]|uniref:hypothetical protein n=1 Tax=Actinoplanes sp. NPDC051343 TaxID=3363906 RepID=UPI003789B97E